jgi:hypothetical protein
MEGEIFLRLALRILLFLVKILSFVEFLKEYFGYSPNTLPTRIVPQDCILCKEKQYPPDILGLCSEEEGIWEIQNLEYCGEFEFLESKKGKQK